MLANFSCLSDDPLVYWVREVGQESHNYPHHYPLEVHSFHGGIVMLMYSRRDICLNRDAPKNALRESACARSPCSVASINQNAIVYCMSTDDNINDAE